MLTKDDLKAIKDIIPAEVNPLKEKLTDIEIKLEETKTDLSMSIFQVRAELKEETTHIKSTLKKIQENHEIIIKHFDREFQSLKQRVDNLEKHLNLN